MTNKAAFRTSFKPKKVIGRSKKRFWEYKRFQKMTFKRKLLTILSLLNTKFFSFLTF